MMDPNSLLTFEGYVEPLIVKLSNYPRTHANIAFLVSDLRTFGAVAGISHIIDLKKQIRVSERAIDRRHDRKLYDLVENSSFSMRVQLVIQLNTDFKSATYDRTRVTDSDFKPKTDLEVYFYIVCPQTKVFNIAKRSSQCAELLTGTMIELRG